MSGAWLTVVEQFFRQPNGKVSMFHQFLSGAAAGFGFWAILYPLDVIKSRMQIQTSDRAQRPYKSVLHCARTIYEKEGPKVYQAMQCSACACVYVCCI